MAEDAFSGVLLVARGDEVLLQRAWGLADRHRHAGHAGHQVPPGFDEQDVHRRGRAAAGQAGRLSLEGSVGQSLPGYPNADIAKVTIRQLLTHAGGTGDIFGPAFDQHRLSLKTRRLRAPVRRAGADYPPGQENTRTTAACCSGRSSERASGLAYEDYGSAARVRARRDATTPAHCRRTSTCPVAPARTARRMGRCRRRLPYRGTAAGGGYSTAADLLKFAPRVRAGHPVVAEKTGRAAPADADGCGYGFMVGQRHGVAAFPAAAAPRA